MRDKKRIERILNLIKELWEKSPDQRLGQLLSNHTRFGTIAGEGKIASIFNYEDEDIEGDLKEFMVAKVEVEKDEEDLLGKIKKAEKE